MRSLPVGCSSCRGWPTPPPPLPDYSGSPDGCAEANCTIFPSTNLSFFAYTPKESAAPDTCWYPWHASAAASAARAADFSARWLGESEGAKIVDGGGGPAETRGTLHYCNVAGSTAALTVPPGAKALDLIVKRGPDCGKAAVRVDGRTVATVDTFGETVEWQAVVPVQIDPSGASPSEVRVEVLPDRNPKASGGWVQIVAANVFWRS